VQSGTIFSIKKTGCMRGLCVMKEETMHNEKTRHHVSACVDDAGTSLTPGDCMKILLLISQPSMLSSWDWMRLPYIEVIRYLWPVKWFLWYGLRDAINSGSCPRCILLKCIHLQNRGLYKARNLSAITIYK